MMIGVLLGIIFGAIAGLIPGLHINNFALIFQNLPVDFDFLLFFILSLGITQTFLDFIPSIFLGIPANETYESLLPGHRLFIAGQGYKAIILTVFGGVFALIISCLILPFFILFIQTYKYSFPLIIPLLLIFTLVILIFKKNTLLNFFVVLFAGYQGLIFPDQIFPLICGYFGLASIIYSLNEKNKFYPQSYFCDFNFTYIKFSLIGVVGGLIVAIFPAIGSNIAASIIRIFSNAFKTEEYLVILGAINTANFFFSFFVFYYLEKARNGAILVLMDKLIFTENYLFFGLIVLLFSGFVAALLTILIAKIFLTNLKKINIYKLSKLIILFMVILVFLFNGFIGLITLFFSTILGLFTLSKNINRSCLMASLIIPVLFYYIFLFI
ncbi:MAG: tripartite tricarboxylate transporter permease [Candidatus ainarchaeum sp.]|nr:tripartite tricarboxylate transporter permease [Candidatus ainarchaeum sp.]